MLFLEAFENVSSPAHSDPFSVSRPSLTVYSMHNDELCELFPEFSEDEIIRSQENLDRYLELACEISEELRAKEGSALTNDDTIPTIKERSNKPINETKL